MSQLNSVLFSRNTAPPRSAAVLSLNVEFLTLPLEPIQITAPPSPVYSVVPVVPKALLSVNLEFIIVPLIPLQCIAPPLDLAVLLVNVQASTRPLCASLCQLIAPPLTSAMLSSKTQ